MSKLSAIHISFLILLGLISISCAVIAPTPIPTPSPSSIIGDFPLKPGNSWTDLSGRYLGRNPSETLTSMRVVTETVVEVKPIASYQVARLHREPSSEIPIYVPPTMQDMTSSPDLPAEYWLLVDGNQI